MADGVRRWAFTALCAAVLLGPTVPLASRATAQTIPCADVFATFARGSGQTAGSSSEVNTFFDELEGRVGGDLIYGIRELGESAYEGHQYPARGGLNDLLEADASWTGPLGGAYRASVEEGSEELVAYLEDRVAACPDEQLVLGGYSQGAHAVGEALFDLSPTVRARIAFVAFFGDPKLHLPKGAGPWPAACRGDTEPWRRGNARCWEDAGILEARDPYLPADLEDDVGSWCDKQDHICTADTTNYLVGHSHDEYPEAEIPEAAQEAAERLAGRTPEHRGDLDLTFRPLQTGVNGLDLMVAFDTTGSMADDIDAARDSARALVNALLLIVPSARVALVDYKDQGDEYVARIDLAFTADGELFEEALGTLEAAGGGDFPESVFSALMTGFNGLAWRDGAAKTALIIGDAPGHDPEPVTGLTEAIVAQRALEIDPVNVYAVPTSSNASTISFFESLAAATDGAVFMPTGEPLADRLLAAIEDISLEPVIIVDSPLLARPGEEVTFNAGNSYDPNAELESFAWDFDGDGTVDAQTTTPTVRHTYPEPFDGLATVVGTSSDGGTGNAVAEVTIASEWPLVPPGPPRDVVLAGSGARSGVLTWNAPDSGGEVTGYRIDGPSGVLAVRTADARQLEVGDFPVDTEVALRITALGVDEDGPPVSSNTLLLHEDLPPSSTSTTVGTTTTTAPVPPTQPPGSGEQPSGSDGQANAPAPSGRLSQTGSNVVRWIPSAISITALGLCLVLASRRRSRAGPRGLP